MVVAVVGGAVGVREWPGQALSETLVEQLGARQLLVVLDNCEHLVEACAELVSTELHHIRGNREVAAGARLRAPAARSLTASALRAEP